MDRSGSDLALVGLALVLVAVLVAYRRQIVSRLTHWKGRPRSSAPYAPLDQRPDVHLAVVGDTGARGRGLHQTAAVMAELDRQDGYDALLLLGDNVYPSGDPAHLDATVFEPFATVLSGGTELLAILGNHDVRHGHGPAQQQALGMRGPWWSRRIGDVLIVGLDSNQIASPDQQAFLDQELQADATWKVVLVHHPPYSAGYQGSSLATRAVVAPLAAAHGVQLVLSGHDHDYQRSTPIDGVTYVVTGAAATSRRTGDRTFTAVSFSCLHFVDLAAFDHRLVLRAVDHDGRLVDEVILDP